MAIGESSMAIGESSMAAQRKEIAAASALDNKNFPVGMRIVAVDDCKISLRLLSKLLSKCEYQVTCFTNAVEALNTIREKKDEIDLVITDVHMPEIDGFQLLEIAGLELDLPVIMLSANDTKESVMKGIMHGACDYLIKPVRIEELRVIWKHVARRRRPLEEFNMDAINNNHETIGDDNAEAVRSGSRGGNRARIATGKRRKEDDSDEGDSDEMESDEKATKKKARVVWTPDLHRKFVNAVSEIGVDKAVPKSILEKMKVEKLTRENVASHLQKYRLYLKRLNSNPHALEAAFDSRNPFSLDLHSFERFRNFHAHGRYRQAANNSSPFHSTRFNNFSVNSPSPSVMPNLAPSSPLPQIGGFPNAGTSNFTLTNNNNQMNLLRGVNGMNSFPSTSNSNYFTHANNNPNYLSMTFPPPASGPLAAPLGYPMTNLPPISGPLSLLGPQFGARPNLIGNELQQAVSSFNTFGSVSNPSITGNPNNSNFGPFINNPATPAVMSAGMGVGPVSQRSGGFGGTTFGAANGVADHMSSSSIHSGDDVSISGLDELLASMQPGEGVDSLPFIDDDFFN